MTASSTVGAIRFGDVLSAELAKIRTLPATWIALAIAIVANTMLGVLASTDAVRIAGRYAQVPIGQFGTLMLAPVYAFLAIAVFAAGGEYRAGQLRVSLLAVPDRNRLFAAKLTASAAVSLFAAVPAVLPGYLLQHAAALAARDLAVGDAVRGLVAILTTYLLVSMIGYGFAVIARTVVTPLAVLFSMPVLVSTILYGVLPDLVRFLPHEAALSFLDMPADPVTALDRVTGLVVVTGWAILFVGGAWAIFGRRDS